MTALDLQDALHLHHLGVVHVLGIDKSCRLFHRIDAPLCPGIGLLLNGAEAGIAHVALLSCPVAAIAHQHRDHIGTKAQIPGESQQDLQLLRVQGSAQEALDLAIERAEGHITVHGFQHIPFGILGSLTGSDMDCLFLGPQAKLPQSSRGTAVAGLAEMQFLHGLGAGISAVDI